MNRMRSTAWTRAILVGLIVGLSTQALTSAAPSSLALVNGPLLVPEGQGAPQPTPSVAPPRWTALPGGTPGSNPGTLYAAKSGQPAVPPLPPRPLLAFVLIMV